MSLVEVVIAIVILGGSLVSLGAFLAKFSRSVADANIRVTAEQLATERLELSRWQGAYASIDTLARTETAVTGHAGYRRTTFVRRIGGGVTDSVDYRIITVSVSNAVMPNAVRRTTVVSAY